MRDPADRLLSHDDALILAMAMSLKFLHDLLEARRKGECALGAKRGKCTMKFAVTWIPNHP